MKSLHQNGFPRNGRYELFIFNGRVKCFDDPLFDTIPESDELHEWVRHQPKKLWSGMKPPHDKIAYYLQPELYTWFKLRWS
jgi:hypothetical protein